MFTWLWDCLFPIQCVGCRHYDYWLCQSCIVLAGKPNHQSGVDIGRPCITTLYWLGDYSNTTLRTSIHGLKYQGWRGLAQPLGQALAATLDRSYDWVIPIPLHRRREHERGFNQSHLLAKALVWPVLPALERYRWTDPQAQLDRLHRQTNIRQAFRLRSHQTQLFHHKNILLLDDVFTTGATTSACAELLLLAGCQRVDVAVIARD